MKLSWIKIGITLIMGILSSIIANIIAKNLSGETMNWIYDHLIAGIWPWYIGLVVASGVYSLYSILEKHKRNKQFRLWLTDHNPNYDQQEFSTLEEKIVYLIKRHSGQKQ